MRREQMPPAAADGMDGVVSIKSLGHQAFEVSSDGDFVTHRHLILDDDMQCGMNFGIGQFDFLSTVIVLDEFHAQIFV